MGSLLARVETRLPAAVERAAYGAYIALDPVRSLEIRPVMNRLSIRPGERVLDLGCGRGYWAARAARAGAAVTAIDLKAEAVRHASRRYPDVTFVHGSAEDTGLEGQSFDVVLLFSVLEHTEDPERVLGEIGRLLRPGGRLGLTTDSFEDARWRGDRQRHAARWAVRTFFARSEVEELVRRCGFQVTWSRALFGFRGAPRLLRWRLEGKQRHWLLAPAVWAAALVAGDTGRGALVALTAVKGAGGG